MSAVAERGGKVLGEELLPAWHLETCAYKCSVSDRFVAAYCAIVKSACVARTARLGGGETGGYVSGSGVFRFVAFVLVLAASLPVLADDLHVRPRWREVREDPAAREVFIEQRREQRERMRVLRQELREDFRTQDAPGDYPERGGLRRVSPEERVRIREDIREVWRERRSRR